MTLRPAIAVTLLMALLAGCGGRSEETEPPPPDVVDFVADGETIHIATWNVRRFFDTVCDSGACTAGAFELQFSQAQFDATADRIARSIEYMATDIVLLQEIENDACFDAIHGRIDDDFPVSVFGEKGDVASMDVGVFSRGELIEVVRHRDATPLTRPDGTQTTFAREFLEVRLAIGESAVAAGVPDVIVFVTHFKSKANDDAGRRQAEAEAAREIIVDTARAFPDALVVLGGDLNDTPGSGPLEALTAEDRLERVAADMRGERATFYLSGSNGVIIDHLLRATDASGQYVPASSFVFRDGAALGYGGSDHGALRSEFVLP